MHKNIPTTICCFLRTVMTSKESRWEYEIWNWQQGWDILQKKDSDSMRQECEVQLNTQADFTVEEYILIS